jgi:hypothetical protein
MSEEYEKSLEGTPATAVHTGAPPTMDRDLALGSFMDAWSQLEAMFRTLLSILSGAPPETSFSIAAAIPDVGRMNDLLLALGDIQLSDAEDRKELKAICKYLLTCSKYRNSIVHGQWVLTNNRVEPTPISASGPAYMWVRVYSIVDKTKAFNAVLGRDEDLAEKHVFTIQRLYERASKARMFAVRVSALSDRIAERVRLPKRGP